MSPQLSMEAAGPQPDARLGQWFSPPDLARDLVRWACVHSGDHVLEPSAGAGNLVRALPDDVRVTAVEIDSRWIPELSAAHPALVARGGPSALRVLHADFFEVAPTLAAIGPDGVSRGRFDVCIANPPYEDALDARILFAAARRSLRVCAIVPLNALATEVRYRAGWRWLAVTRLQICCTRPGFGGQHGGGMRDIAFVEVVERAEPRGEGEEDLVRVGWRP